MNGIQKLTPDKQILCAICGCVLIILVCFWLEHMNHGGSVASTMIPLYTPWAKRNKIPLKDLKELPVDDSFNEEARDIQKEIDDIPPRKDEKGDNYKESRSQRYLSGPKANYTNGEFYDPEHKRRAEAFGKKWELITGVQQRTPDEYTFSQAEGGLGRVPHHYDDEFMFRQQFEDDNHNIVIDAERKDEYLKRAQAYRVANWGTPATIKTKIEGAGKDKTERAAAYYDRAKYIDEEMEYLRMVHPQYYGGLGRQDDRSNPPHEGFRFACERFVNGTCVDHVNDDVYPKTDVFGSEYQKADIRKVKDLKKDGVGKWDDIMKEKIGYRSRLLDDMGVENSDIMPLFEQARTNYNNNILH